MTRRSGNPQLEHGHTRIANELLDMLARYPFGGGELKILLAIIRLTYGWNRTRYPIRQTTLSHLTHLDRRQVQRVLITLRQQGVLFCHRTTRPFTYELNKAYKGWRDWPPEMFASQDTGCELSSEGDSNVAAAPDRSVRPSKEIKKKNKETVHDPTVDNLVHRLTQILNRSLTPEEHELVARLHDLSPLHAQQLLSQVMAAHHPTAQLQGGTHVYQASHPGG